MRRIPYSFRHEEPIPLLPEDSTSKLGSQARALCPEERDWLNGRSPNIWLLYLGLKKKFFFWDPFGAITARNSKKYVAFGVNGNTFVSLFPQERTKLMLVLNVKKDNLHDPDGLAENLIGKRHPGTGDWRVCISNDSELERAMPLIRQAYDAGKTKPPRKLRVKEPEEIGETEIVYSCAHYLFEADCDDV